MLAASITVSATSCKPRRQIGPSLEMRTQQPGAERSTEPRTDEVHRRVHETESSSFGMYSVERTRRSLVVCFLDCVGAHFDNLFTSA